LTRRTLRLLEQFESRNITFIDPEGDWPIVWNRASGNFVWDADGKRYIDLTAAFGVAAAGHGNSEVSRAGRAQMRKLMHAMGDVHPHPLKAELARELSRITFERWTSNRESRARQKQGTITGKTIFCNSGFEAVEAALKTALLATGKPGVIAFEGAYHGLGYGALNTTHRQHFRAPFRAQLAEFGEFIVYRKTATEVPAEVLRHLRGGVRGAVERTLRSPADWRRPGGARSGARWRASAKALVAAPAPTRL
jgi:4-aminobutyrate aminotransferase-like enzyme